MLKQSFSKAKKVLTILLAVLFVASLTVGAASACNIRMDIITVAVHIIPVVTVIAATGSLVTNVAAAAKPSVSANR